ncbi:nicotinate-nicotinamide nucleotide adenylyltransferase [Aminipila luticellarii]|uniref:nicotinate-nucleotide adenylyltransferase n=1 Tax=Aminipila luticellarii TaxID=2507160 RepID=A0A410PUC2_9FIRM|nr:hypothetical protein [Aminipila luticellarii]QAT42571.1 hypothetical protein EQM06_04670 [Aminipila luticellarii]
MMYKKAVTEIYRQLEKSLTDRDFLKEADVPKKIMVKLLRDQNWQARIAELLSLEKMTCTAIAEASRSTISALDTEPEEGWLECIKNNTIERLFPTGTREEKRAGTDMLLRIIRIFIQWQNANRAFDPSQNIELLAEEEFKSCPVRDEYMKFIRFWNDSYIYEFMLIFKELTSFNTVGHIAGVHFVAMHIARQLKKLGMPIDMALVSGAAAGHDLGKYGCKPHETEKIPYLHYYYSDQLFKENGMPTIAHIAANHSTWDLELENLSVESLVLIYADFRVKSSRDKDGDEIVHFYSLEESFDIILNKLDHVNEEKSRRYIRVYSKLSDFEKYMKDIGISVDLNSNCVLKADQKGESLLNTQQTIAKLKFLAIEHNITLMSHLNNDISFANLLEKARSEKQWKSIRAYLNIFSEYSTYMTQKQKLYTLHFLYELLMHREGDIRRQAAGIMAAIIVNYDEDFRKELPEDAHVDSKEMTALELWKQFIEQIIFPDYKVTEQHKRWIRYSLKTLMTIMLEKCRTEVERQQYLDVFFSHFQNRRMEDGSAFMMLATALVVPLGIYSKESMIRLMTFAGEMSERDSLEIKIAALRCAKYVAAECEDPCVIEKIKPSIVQIMEGVHEDRISVAYLKYKILSALGEYTKEKCLYEEKLYKENQVESDLYLENLKIDTPWVIKAVNIEFLLDKLNRGMYEEKLHIATHFSNLVKVSERITVRHSAGKGLLQVIKLLSLDQRNEIIIEMTKGLEIGEYQFSKYIPEYLGELAMYLHPRELDELLGDLKKLSDSTNQRIASVALDTLGVMIKKYPGYGKRFEEAAEIYEKRRELMIGILLRGFANYDEIISQEAFLVIGQSIFGSGELSLQDKRTVFEQTYKKIVTLIADKKENELSFYNNAAALNHIYRFITDYLMQNESFDFADPSKVAFFPGTFDPFSLSHKGIVQEIKKLGFEVYLALDEFSWSKRTQPRMIRKQIVSMSVADESGVYIFPDHISVNLANPADLRRLKKIFADKDLYMVVGSDVIAHASSYKKSPEPDSIHHMNHIVFKRDSEVEGSAEANDSSHSVNPIQGAVIELKLPVHLEDISSTRIRENIDNDRDISNLIDTVAQNYIYRNSLYLREPQYKSVIRSSSIILEVIKHDNAEIFCAVSAAMGGLSAIKDSLSDYVENKEVTAMVIKNGSDYDRVLGVVLFHELDTVNLYREFHQSEAASYIREHSSGKVAVLGALLVSADSKIDDLEQILLTEALADCLRTGFTYAVYNPIFSKSEAYSQRVEAVMRRQGFFNISEDLNGSAIYFVDMQSPVILFENMEMRIKSPFDTNQRILQVLKQAHINMQNSLTQIYKGSLVLSFNSGIMHHRLVDMITAVNGVSREHTKIRRLGPYMCVPFGKILDGKAVPNTVTKTLHTEKIFDTQVRSFKIKEFPNYTTLENQIGTIESFHRPVLLVDDMLHKGYRLKELDPIFKKTDIQVEKIIVGVLSGKGKDLMAIQGRNVDSAYFIPHLRTWFIEDAMYPFLGGDSVEREYSFTGNLIPSVNMILPYVLPAFLAGEDRRAVFTFSLTCLKNAEKILKVLEEEFQRTFEKNLTLNRLGEVIYSPRCPDKGYCIGYDENLAPSVYVSNDIEKLMRLKNMV